MDTTEGLNKTDFVRFKILTNPTAYEMECLVSSGWRLLETRVERPSPNEDGSFSDRLHATFGNDHAT